MDQAITRAAGAAPRAVGEFDGYVDGEPTVRWIDRKNMPNVGDMLFSVPGRELQHAGFQVTIWDAPKWKPNPRSWSILLTSENHGTVGPVGSTFPHAGEKHERVQVVEIVDAGAPPAPDVDLVGLVRLPLTTEQIDDAWDSLPSRFWRGQGEYEWNCEKRRAFARAIERKVAAQAGQVAVPEWISVDERLPDAGHCLATYRNQHGKLRIIRAKYTRQFEIDAGEDAIDQGNCEYNEADDNFYLKAGWLECIDNWDDYSSIYVTEGEVTHWMPLPPSPAKESK